MKFIYRISLSLILAFVAVSPSYAFFRKKKKTGEKVKAETKYDKLFKDKKYQTAKGFMTIHLTEDGKLLFEVPKNIIGRELLLTSSVDKTSDSGEGATGFISPKSIAVSFHVKDSLLYLKESEAYRYAADEEQMKKSLEAGHIGAIVAKFPIKAYSPDSSYVIDATSYFTSSDKRLEPIDEKGSNTAGGLLNSELTMKRNLSMPYKVSGYPTNMSVINIQTYSKIATFFGMRSAGGGKPLTMEVRRSIFLLPETIMEQRPADSRIGVNAIIKTRFKSSDKGTKREYSAMRWRMDKPLVFYVDTLLSEKVRKAAMEGVLKWNQAFEEIGMKGQIDARLYPSNDSTFDANDLRYSCIKFEASPNSSVRSQTWTDPRSGEIISAQIYIPFDALKTIHSDMFLLLGTASESIRTTDNDNHLVYQGLQAEVTHHTGRCLGFTTNLAGTLNVPVDSLSSPEYTSKYGLSNSVMDYVPYNFIAGEGAERLGVKLVNTELGAYDKYAVKWLYGAIPDDKAKAKDYLDSLIIESKKDKRCLFIRYNPASPDPRALTSDLGDDPFKALRLKNEHIKYVISNMDKWISGQDRDYSFRTDQNTSCVMNTYFSYGDFGKLIGGVYLNDKVEGENVDAAIPVSKELQQRAMKTLLELSDDLSWMDNKEAYKDMFDVVSRGDYLRILLVGDILGKLGRFNTSVVNSPYSLTDAYEDIFDHTLSKIKGNKEEAKKSLITQYTLLGYTLGASKVENSEKKEGKGNIMAERKTIAEENLWLPSYSGTQFAVPDFSEGKMYEKLMEIRKVYRNISRTETDRNLKNHYIYLLSIIDKALKID